MECLLQLKALPDSFSPIEMCTKKVDQGNNNPSQATKSSPRPCAVGVKPCWARYSELWNFDRWRAPPSHKMVAMIWPGPSARAILTAPTQFIADELPMNRPSFRSRYAAISTASLSVPLKALSTRARAKFLVRRLIPIPSVMVSNGLRSRFPSASSLVYMTPRVTLLYSPDPGGSIRTICILGSLAFKYCDTPPMVPPVPAPDTNACSLPPDCSQISRPVSRWALKLAAFSN
mmetsp:Transcript_7302/g.19552  ORF Transcript_7302/g.19552 Transcript_7302/m.19552 type:complete len:232 (+) Transcript_7302:46-741(+)